MKKYIVSLRAWIYVEVEAEDKFAALKKALEVEHHPFQFEPDFSNIDIIPEENQDIQAVGEITED